MCANDAIDVARLEPSNHFLCFCVGEETRQNFYFDGVAGESVRECIAMLRCKQCGGHKDCNLHSVLYCFERSTNGDLCFAEPNVPTEQAIHWHFTFHVGFDGFDCFELIGRFHKWKSSFHLCLPRSVLRECMTLCSDTTLIQHHKFLRDFLHS